MSNIYQPNYDWWNSLSLEGNLLSSAQVKSITDNFQPREVYRWNQEKLYDSIARLKRGDDKAISEFLEVLFEKVLGYKKDEWQQGSNIESSWTQRAGTGEAIRPRRIWTSDKGFVLPVFVTDASLLGSRQKATSTRLGVGNGRRAVAKVVEWLRKSNIKLGLVTNGKQLRLIYAGADFRASCEWEIERLFESGVPGSQFFALQYLLDKAQCSPETANQDPPLLNAIEESRKGQTELSRALGERVREAVELLIRVSRENIETLLANPNANVSNRDIYVGATRVILRMVVILFAESRELLPKSTNTVYYNSYSLVGLREILDRMSDGKSRDRLRRLKYAWPRLLSLFNVINKGSHHPDMLVPQYGGELFKPGSLEDKDPVTRALTAFEHDTRSISDADVNEIIDLITRAQVKVKIGNRTTLMWEKIDFAQLDTEYIGILYEGLLDYELRKADGETFVLIQLGDMPILPLWQMEQMSDDQLDKLVERLKKKSGPKIAAEESKDDDTDDDDDSDEDADADDTDDDDTESEETESEEEQTESEEQVSGDTAQTEYARALAWAIKAVKAGKLVPKPRGKKPDAIAAYEKAVEAKAKWLVPRKNLSLPGDWYLVRWGGTRKGAGTFYTRPQLATPTIKRTLLPLTNAKDGKPLPPDKILSLKVCDPACGSGSFLIGSLRYLSEVLKDSLFEHKWLEEGEENEITVSLDKSARPRWFTECVRDIELRVKNPEEHILARLKRFVVERCLYGVDLDPLAVELTKVSLWIETMDYTLPFGFLNHKIKPGNSLVGCWYDTFQDYPLMAWEREGGDKNHTKGVHFKKEEWTKKIKEKRKQARQEYDQLVTRKRTGQLELETGFKLPKTPDQIHDEAAKDLDALHDNVIDPLKSQQLYIDFEREVVDIRAAFNTWCAVWFWPPNDIGNAPTPYSFYEPTEHAKESVEALARSLRFFHWEIEFPDVFRGEGTGFDAILGNPPWEIQKPNSKEFFSNIDPLYRGYGKQEALGIQRTYFKNERTEREWMEYCAGFKAFSNFNKHAYRPLGENGVRLSKPAESYADSKHPFRYQGSADINTYKMFLEVGHALLRNHGRMGFIVPSGVYTDKGSTDLRTLFIQNCNWEWLFGFENRDGIFDIHRSFKFCPIVVEKGRQTIGIKAAFMRRDVRDWERADEYILTYPRDRIEQFSPNSRAILEIRSDRDLKILEKIYANSVLLGDQGPDGWGIQYAREFDMTNDSELFPPRKQWEDKGYRPDEYGHWLKGNWKPYSGPASILKRPAGTILSQDGNASIHVDEIEDVALPLYQGLMIWNFDFSFKSWEKGTGRSAKWNEIDWSSKSIGPQYLMTLNNYCARDKVQFQSKVSLRRITTAVHQRTAVCAIVPNMPCGDKASIIQPFIPELKTRLCALVNSLVYDFIAKQKCSYLQLDYHVIADTPLVKPSKLHHSIARVCERLNLAAYMFAKDWLKSAVNGKKWKQLWAITQSERNRLRCILDAVLAQHYGLETSDFTWVLRDCDHPVEQSTNKKFTRNLDPKGFWRVDKDKDPELRHTVLSLVAFHELKKMGLDAFLNQNDGEGWMLPDTLRLADYGLGHDDRAKEHQPVASRLGPRFLPWQLEGTPEESWEECRLHAEMIDKIMATGIPATDETTTDTSTSPTDMFGNPIATNLFGEQAAPKRKRK